MFIIVCYDVNTENLKGRRRLRKVARICENYGQRVQKSVFECLVDPVIWEIFKGKLFEIYDPELDSLRFYFLNRNWKERIEHYGIKPSLDLEGPLLF